MSSPDDGAPDPFDELRAHDPAAALGPSSPDSEVARQAFERIVATPRHPGQTRGRLAIAAATALVVGTASGAWAIARRNDDGGAASCYAAVDLAARHVTVVASSAAVGEQACATAWSDGELGPGPTPAALVGCTLVDGGVGFFPADDGDPCARLDLPVAMPGDLTDDPTAAFRDEVIRALDAECLSIADATAVVVGAAARHDLDWRVEGPATIPSRTCASPAFDDERRIVTLVPIPAP